MVLTVGDGKDIRFEDPDRDMEQLRVGLDFLPVDLVVARVHHQIDAGKRDLAVTFQLLHAFRHQHGILSSGNADRDPVALADQPVLVDSVDERMPDGFPVFGDDAALSLLIRLKMTFHAVSLLS